MSRAAADFPKLRFPEFRDPWVVRRVDDLLTRSIKPVAVALDTNYRQIGIRSHSRGIFHKEPVSGQSLGNKRVFWVEPECFVVNIVFAWEQAVAKTTDSEKGMIASHRFPMYAAVENLANVDFIRWLFMRPKGKHLLGLASPGGAGRNRTLGQSEFAKLKIKVPCALEQKKVSDFLTSVDTRIQQLSKKKTLLKRWKKGLMQKLFSQTLRFKDDNGNDFPDWEEKKYSEIYSFKNTNSLSRDRLNYESGTVRNIHYGDIHKKFKSNFYLKKERVPFINSDVNLSRIGKECYCREGDLVMADASEDYADIGKCVELRDLGGQLTLAGLHTFIARPVRGKVAPGFGGYLMQSRDVRLKVMKIAQGTKVLGLSKKQLSILTLTMPHPDEQEKIANCLSSIDKKIDSIAMQIEKTKAFKQGLLQQMFV